MPGTCRTASTRSCNYLTVCTRNAATTVVTRPCWGRRTWRIFLNRIAYLESTGAVSAKRRPLICEHVAKVLRDARDLGLTRPGEPAAGLPDMFALRSVDIPPVMKLDGPGRALPQAVLRQLYENLSALETSTRHARQAIELLIDTGRRPEEILRLPHDCLDTAADGKHVLVCAEFKINREGRRLPITDTTLGPDDVLSVQQSSRRTSGGVPTWAWRTIRNASWSG